MSEKLNLDTLNNRRIHVNLLFLSKLISDKLDFLNLLFKVDSKVPSANLSKIFPIHVPMCVTNNLYYTSVFLANDVVSQ